MTYASEVLADSPLIYWKFDETSGTSAADASGNSRTGTYFNSATVGQASLIPSDSSGKSVDLSGSSQSVFRSHEAWMNVSAITVEAWIRLDGSPGADGFHAVVAKEDSSLSASARAWNLLVSAAGVPTFTVFTASTARIATGATTLSLNTTYHIVGTYDGSNVKVYINGAQDGTAAASGTMQTTSFALQVGKDSRSGTGRSLNGRVDGFSMFGSALSAGRIASHFAAGSAPITGTFAATLPLTTASFTGTHTSTPSGSFAATLPVTTADFAGTYTPPPNPTGDFAAVLPLVTASFSGDYFPHESGTFAAVLPLTTAAFDGTYTPPAISGSFAATLPLITASFTGVGGTLLGSFAAVLPLTTARFSGSYGGPYPTDTSNTEDGLDIICLGIVTVTRPVVAPPASLVLAQKYDLAVAYPEPDMNNGRPE